MSYGIIQSILNLLFPNSRCIICHSTNGVTGCLCEQCRNGLVPITDCFCPKCGKPLVNPTVECRYCSHDGHLFTAARAAGVYEGPMKQAVIVLKYYGRKAIARTLGDMMHGVFKRSEFSVQAIVPVPLSRARLKARGYNQAELLARRVSELSGVNMVNGLVRETDTISQTYLSRTQRLKNLEGAFKLTDTADFKGKNVLLIDDTMTTGATADECSRVLLSSGAVNVYVLTAATAVFR